MSDRDWYLNTATGRSSYERSLGAEEGRATDAHYPGLVPMTDEQASELDRRYAAFYTEHGRLTFFDCCKIEREYFDELKEMGR